MQLLHRVRRCVAVCAATLLVGAALGPVQVVAAEPPASARQSIDNFFKLEQFVSARMNPSGTHLAYIREVNGRYNLVSMDVATRKLTNVAGFDRVDVAGFEWINDKRLIFYVYDRRIGIGDVESYGIHSADVDGTRPLVLRDSGFDRNVSGSNRGMPYRASFWSRARSGDPDDFIVAQYADAPFRVTLLRVNARDGQRRSVDHGGLANVTDWALDWNDVPRAAVSRNRDRLSFHVRDSESAPWRKVAEFGLYDNTGFSPVAFDKAGTLYVSAYMGRDTAAIHRFDFAKGAPEPESLISVKNYDIEGGLLFNKDGTLRGVRYHADQEGIHWVDPAWQTHQQAIDAALPGRVNLLGGMADATVLVRSYSDTSPSRYYLLDTRARKLSLLGASRPWIDEKLQARSDVIRYKARDGLIIPALLTLPRGVDPKNLPLVVFPHGGPWVRGIDWEWNAERQFLASRGYAVLEPDFRGSTGHGWKLFRSGWKQWGMAMQDDLADGVLDLASRGMVDKNRVCITGASYGGYATVMGLIRHPELFKCGISWVGVTDMELLHTVGWSDTAGSPEARLSFEVLAGDPVKDREMMRANSAIHQAARLKQPLIIAYGLADVRVPYDHGQKLRDALKGHNKNVDYIEYAGEGHGWNRLETHVDFWSRAEKMLADTIGR
jgi:dipeptidyl aminopeptidase/acylaminoacyl peptidase